MPCFGKHTFDRFASHINNLCDKFSSRFSCPGATAVNAFSQDWTKENNWSNAPFALIPRVWDYALNKGHQQHYLCHNGNLRIGGHYYTMAQHGTHGWSITSKSQIHGIMIYFYLMIKVQSSHLNGVHLFWRLPLEHRNWQIYSTNRQVDYYE